MSMPLEDLHREIDRRWPKHLEATRDLLRMPSVSMTGEGIQEMAETLSGWLDGMGAKTRLFKAGRKSHPLVTGYLDAGSDVTGILYGMYDVQPVGDPDLWDHPPFGAEIVKKKPFGDVVVARGACNSKGSLAGTLLAIRTMVDEGEMPLNLHFLIEGEEELGGESLPKYVMKNKATLSKADSAWGFDYMENERGVPEIVLGMKGCVYFDLEARGGPQGGPLEGDVHSSDAVVIHSPVWRLVQALSTMVDEDQDPAIDGLSDDAKGPTEDDMKLIRRLARTIDIDDFKKGLSVAKLKAEGTKEQILTKYLFEPSVNIDGLIAGYTEDGTKTILPGYAKAKLDIRTVPGMTIEGTRRKVMQHLRRRGFTDITMRNYIDYPWSKTPLDTAASQASIEAMRYHGKEPEVWPMMTGSAPFYLFDQVLGIPYGSGGLGHASGAHSPNEYAVVEGMSDFEKSVVTVLTTYVRMMRGHPTA
jgi:acetylornithine deacetylase/succinyl-diaminopimelate desuccinylase-like protein